MCSIEYMLCKLVKERVDRAVKTAAFVYKRTFSPANEGFL
jgi:hypothetical protein